MPEDRRRLAFEELLIAEGSDWCWWYGPEHDSANRPEFDQLYRSHLANVYRFLNLTPPEELSRPILRIAAPAVLIAPSGPITPVIDGEVTSYFEWLGAGIYRVDERSGSMHGKKFLVKEVLFGTDGQSFYLRIDFHPGYEQEPGGMEARFTGQTLDGARSSQVTIGLVHGAAKPVDVRLAVRGRRRGMRVWPRPGSADLAGGAGHCGWPGNALSSLAVGRRPARRSHPESGLAGNEKHRSGSIRRLKTVPPWP